MIKVILIDIDDTLLSFAGYVKQSMKEGFAHFDIAEYDDEMYTVFEEINSGLYDYFDYYFISEKVGARKPNKEYFDYCFKAVEEKIHEPILPEEVMIIGDSVTSDICGGKKNGLKTCLYMGSSASYRDDAEADYVVERLEEVKGIL